MDYGAFKIIKKEVNLMQKPEKSEKLFESFQREKLDRMGRFERKISSEKVRKVSDGIFLAIFFAFFIIPIFYVFIWSLINWNAINFAIFNMRFDLSTTG